MILPSILLTSSIAQKGIRAINIKLLALALPILCMSPAFAAKHIALNLSQNDSNQSWTNETDLIGPLQTATAAFNNTNNPPGGALLPIRNGNLNSGNLADLVEYDTLTSSGTATAVKVSWTSSNTWYSGSGIGTNESRLTTGYLDDGGSGTNVTFTSVPYERYNVYLILASDHSGTTYSSLDFNVNGNPVIGSSFAAFSNWSNSSANGAWSEADGNTTGNYILARNQSGETLVVQGQTRNGAQRGSLAAVIIESVATVGQPEVENLPPTDVESTTASANANLIDNGTGEDTATLTIHWGTNDGGSNPGSWENSTAAGTRTTPGTFSTELTGLLPNTTYYYRSHVTNSIGDDWAPTSESFSTAAMLPTVQNLAASDIFGTSATIGANVISTGGEVPDVVIHYGDNDAGTGSWDSQLNLGYQSSAASGSITGLNPATTYYFRSAATNSEGTAWAESSSSFSTPAVAAPILINSPATNINDSYATLRGEITDPGGDPPTVTVYYGTTDGGSIPGEWQLSSPVGTQTGSFSRLVTNLQPTTTYYFRASAQNIAGQTWASPSLSFTTPAYAPPTIVINEIHYDEADKTVRAEFIELYNPSDSPVDLSGYAFTSGVDFIFPAGTILESDSYAVVAEDTATMQSRFGYSGALGPFANGTTLRNSGERLTLSNPVGTTIDEVTYRLGFPWPTVGDEVGSPLASPSIELINPLLDNDLGGSWRASGFPVAVEGGSGGDTPTTLLASGQAGWRYRKGTSYPVQDATSKTWWDVDYDDSVDGEWLDGTAVVGYSDGDDTTILTDMRYNYISIFLRKEFTIEAGKMPDAITLNCYHDDGAVIYLNGVEVHRFSTDSGAIAFPPPQGFANSHDAAWSSATINGVSSYLVEGTNVIAIQCINTALTSSDLSIDAEIITNPAGTGDDHSPSPGARNRSSASNAPPQIRQVDHLPEEPRGGDEVIVTAKVTDPDGVAEVSLQYQVVEPGDYFCRYLKFNNNGSPNLDPRYEDPAEWRTLAMNDDGTGGDALSADLTYTVTLPASLQLNRRLIRYRITTQDTTGSAITVPYQDDPQPNFAYFVYDGTPEWSGVIRPGDTPETYSGSQMSSIATYFLLSTNTWVDDSQFGGYGGSEYLWPGTMVYDGKIYDHIQYRPRGGGHRFDYGKNFWKFNFTRGHRFEARDRNGKRYATDWDKLNFSSIVQQVGFGHRGEQGLFEGVGFRMFELCGVPACKTHYTQFYVVDQASATGADQYEGDYYGLFLAIEQMDGRYLNEHGLPDGNLYKIEGYNGDSNNQGPYQVSDGSDVSTFINTYRSSTPSAQWWRDNLDVENYLSYRTVVEGIHHYDIANGKNYFYYHNPDNNRFQVLPWDLDLTWANNMYGSGNHDFKTMVAQNPAFNTNYQNRMREIMDLLYNDDEGHKLIDEMVRDVWTADSPSLVGADRRLWDNNPRLNAKDRYYDISADNDFSGMIQILKDYISTRGAWMTTNLLRQEGKIPATPSIQFSGEGDFPSNDLQFTSSGFSSPEASDFAAMEWRISEVYNPAVPNYLSGEPYIYEIQDPSESGELTTFNSTYLFPALTARPGQTYRARVRHQDVDNRWSHWSAPVEFLVTQPDVAPYVAALRITELNYHPIDPSPAEEANGWDDSDFEYIELQNISTNPIDLSDLRFTKGVDFDFPPGTSIDPGAFLLVIKNQAAFESRYGHGLQIAGEWAADDKLSNSGENVKLSLGAGTAVIEFTYSDTAPWPSEPDGDGFSLTLNTPYQTQPEDHADPLAWRASRLPGGSPGTDDHLDFSNWATDNGLPADASMNGDPDADGLSNMLEYALASNPLVPSTDDLPTGALEVINPGTGPTEYLTMSFRRQTATADLSYTVQVSTDLATWWNDDAVRVSSTNQGDGTAIEVWRTSQPSESEAEQFMRLRVDG